MKKVLIIIVLLCGSSILHGQVADSTSWRGQGEPVLVTGKGMMLGGAMTAAAGGGLMLLAVSPILSPKVPEGEFSENMLAPLTYIAGLCTVMAGASVLLAGIPVTVAGNSMMNCDVPWRDARYDSRGLGVILEGGYWLPDILEARASLGYHFNSHIFLGAGAAPGVWLDQSSRAPGISRLTLPVYADFRWSFCNRMITPYLGLSAGVEMVDDPFSPYLGAELGTRIRTHLGSTRSFWSAISGEVAGGYMRVGIKMGYSF
ncbi:MAG: hypothetical protein IK031_06665 [Bacteroidales bacterium]|nr:hypothetical protein [Bacteroidales bacterium]